MRRTASVRQRAGQFGLADPGGAEEDERPHGSAWVLDTGAGADDGVGHQPYGLVLTDHPLVQDLVQAEQLVALALLEPVHRDARPAGDDGGDLLLGDHLAQQPAPALLLRQPFLLDAQATLQLGYPAMTQLGGEFEVVVALGALGLLPDLFQLGAQLLHLPQGLPFRLPLSPHGAGFGPYVRKLLAQVRQPGLARGIVLLGQRRVRARPVRQASSRSRCGASRTPHRPGRWPCQAGIGRRCSDG